MRARLVPGTLAVVALTSGVGAAVVRPTAHGPGSPSTALSVPVLSARRLPSALAAVVADERLAQRLEVVLGALDGGTVTSCMEVQVAGQTVYGHGLGASLVPASNLKLLTAVAAVHRLGPTMRLTTEARVGHAVGSDGVVGGPLWLVGGGDPLVTTAAYRPSQHEWTWSTEPATHLEELADRIKGAGVRAITGGVLGDDSRYDRQRSVPAWKPSYLADGEIGAVGALVVNGGFTSATRRAPAATPAMTAASELTRLLLERGVRVDGAPGYGIASPVAVRVASVDSLPVSQIVAIMLRESDNLTAEMLVKELGHRFGGAGSWGAGLGVVRDTLAAMGLPLDGLELADGSGLARADRVTCGLLVRTIDAPAAAAILGGLPVAGRDGTLAQRMLGQPPAGRLRAKTGSLSGVAALTGLIDLPAGAPRNLSPPAFALLVNNLVSDASGRRLEDQLAAALATYPEAPPPDSLAPGGQP